MSLASKFFSLFGFKVYFFANVVYNEAQLRPSSLRHLTTEFFTFIWYSAFAGLAGPHPVSHSNKPSVYIHCESAFHQFVDYYIFFFIFTQGNAG